MLEVPINKILYKSREIAKKSTHYDYAFNFVRYRVVNNYDEETFIKAVHYSGDYFASVATNQYYGSNIKGKLRVRILDKGVKFFSIKQILNEVKKQQKQRILL